MLLVVISLDRDDRNSCFLQHAEAGERVVHCFRRHVSLMKKVSAHQHKIHLAVDGISLQNIDPRVEKIPRAFRQLIARAAQMDVRNMQKLHPHIVTDQFAAGLC